MEQKQNKMPVIDLKKIINAEEIPKIYVNGFATFRGNSDIGIAFQCNGKTNLVINMSFTLAKTLAEKLGEMIDDFEEITETKIMTTDVVDVKVQQKGKLKNNGK